MKGTNNTYNSVITSFANDEIDEFFRGAKVFSKFLHSATLSSSLSLSEDHGRLPITPNKRKKPRKKMLMTSFFFKKT